MLQPVKILQASKNFVEFNSPLSEGCPKGGVLKSGDYSKNENDKNKFYKIKESKITHQCISELPRNKNLKEHAKTLRNAENLSEVLFWLQVTKKRFHQIDFDRQRIIGNYIVDFYIKKLGLVIEIDGASHDFDCDYDEKREIYLISLGLKVYRITVADVMKNMDFVLMGLENYIIENYS